MGFKNTGFIDPRFNPIGFRFGQSGGVPFAEDALHYSRDVLDTTRPDRTGIFDRTSVMAKKFVGDGSMYIDTGIVPNQNTVLKVRGKINSLITTEVLFGQRTANGSDALNIFNTSGVLRFDWGASQFSVSVSADNNIHDFEINNGEFFIDDVKVAGTAGTSIGTPTNSIFLHGLNNNGSPAVESTIEIFYAEIIHNGSTITFIAEEITAPTDNSQTTFYDTSGTYEAQAFLTSATWVQNSVQAPALSDQYGYVLADGSTMYKDEAKTLLYDAGQPVHAKDNGDGTFSRSESKGWK
jgi:hypothetical protein